MPLIICQKQSFADVLQKICSYEFYQFYRKTPVLQSLFNKDAGLSTISQENTCVGISFWLSCSPEGRQLY